MKLLRLWYGLVGLVLALAVTGCSPPEPKILAATLGTEIQSGKVTNPATTFAPSDRMIHLVVELENLVGNTNVGAKWYSVGTPDNLLFESDLSLDAFNNSADFTLTNTNNWLPGNYKVVIFLNEKEARQVNFVVR